MLDLCPPLSLGVSPESPGNEALTSPTLTNSPFNYIIQKQRRVAKLHDHHHLPVVWTLPPTRPFLLLPVDSRHTSMAARRKDLTGPRVRGARTKWRHGLFPRGNGDHPGLWQQPPTGRQSANRAWPHAVCPDQAEIAPRLNNPATAAFHSGR